MEGPYIRIEETGVVVSLSEMVTTVGRGTGVDIRLADPSVSRLHAEIVRRGPYAYVADLGLSRNGTRVNGRLVARRVLEDGDVLSFGTARCRVGGIAREDIAAEVELRRSASPELTRRELDVLTSLCRPALSDEAFVAPATAREIAADLVVTEAAVKQHLLRLYQKFRIPEGPNRRVRLANEVIALGLVRPLPPAERADLPQPRAPEGRTDAVPPRPAPGRRDGGRPAQPASPHAGSTQSGSAQSGSTQSGSAQSGSAQPGNGSRERTDSPSAGGRRAPGGPPGGHPNGPNGGKGTLHRQAS